MRLPAIGFLLGVIVFQQLARLPAWYWYFALLLLASPTLFYPKFYPKFFSLVFVILGFCWSSMFAYALLSHELPTELEGQDLFAEGSISSIPRVNPGRIRFEFTINRLWKIEKNQKDKAEVLATLDEYPQKVMLNWYRPPSKLKTGQQWLLRIRLKKPHGFRNPGGFDYEAWLLRQGVRATGYVKSPKIRAAESNMALANTNPRFGNTLVSEGPGTYLMQSGRQHLVDQISEPLEHSPFRGIITALVVGERDAITSEQWATLSATGTNHLIAISGLHIGLIAGFAFFLMRWIWGRWAFAAVRFPAQKAAALAAIFFAASYAALAGFAIPTQRALVMVIVVMLSLLLQRNNQPGNILSTALLAVLLIDPLAVLDSGFWLSFAAVAFILYGMAGRIAPKGVWWQWGRAQWLVFMGLAPILLWFFQNLALPAPVANLIAIPWISFLTVPVSLAGSIFMLVFPDLGALLLQLAHYSLAGLWPILQWLASFEQPQWLAVKPPIWTVFVAIIGIIWYLAPRGVPARWVGLIWLMPMFLVKQNPIPEGAAELTLLDVGQGLAAVIRTRQHVLVYDSGPRFSSGFDTGQAVVVPYLRHHGISQIDRFVVSHGDNDHIGGAESILSSMTVNTVYTSVVNEFSAHNTKPCINGSHWEWNGVKFRFIHPDVDDFAKGKKSNNLSCVLMVQSGSAKALLTGDIEKSVEKKLVRHTQRSNIDADLLLVPHHGSKTSSTEQFIDQITPQFALLAVGYKNRFGFPKKEVVERYRRNNIPLLDTAQYGAITFTLHESGGVELKDLYRRSAQRYWHSEVPKVKWYSF